jgi:hypothetical protein
MRRRPASVDAGLDAREERPVKDGSHSADEDRGLVLFLHGSWIHASSWARWCDLVDRNGYDCIALRWPGELASVDDTRAARVLAAPRPGRVSGLLPSATGLPRSGWRAVFTGTCADAIPRLCVTIKRSRCAVTFMIDSGWPDVAD